MAQTLISNGFHQVRALKGGWDAWLAAKGAVEPKNAERKEAQPRSEIKKKTKSKSTRQRARRTTVT